MTEHLATAERQPKYVNISQASRLIGVGASSIRGWILAHKLPAIRTGWQYRIRVKDLMKANEESLQGVGAKQRARRRKPNGASVPEPGEPG